MMQINSNQLHPYVSVLLEWFLLTRVSLVVSTNQRVRIQTATFWDVNTMASADVSINTNQDSFPLAQGEANVRNSSLLLFHVCCT